VHPSPPDLNLAAAALSNFGEARRGRHGGYCHHCRLRSTPRAGL